MHRAGCAKLRHAVLCRGGIHSADLEEDHTGNQKTIGHAEILGKKSSLRAEYLTPFRSSSVHPGKTSSPQMNSHSNCNRAFSMTRREARLIARVRAELSGYPHSPTALVT